MKFAAQAALLCVLALPAMGAAPPSALSSVIAHMRAVNGGLYRAHILSTSPHAPQGDAPALRSETQGLQFVVRQCTGSVCLGTYFDGTRLYATNINDTALPRSPAPEAYLRAMRIVGSLQFLSADFISQGGAIEDGGYAAFDGKRCRRIFVSDKIATPMIVYVDPQTWLVSGAQDVDGNAIYTMRDYRKVGLFTLPFEIDRNGAPLEIYTERRIADGPLRKPTGVRGVPVSGATMALDPQSTTPLGTCTIAGVSAPCLIDSGNSAMSMSLELAEQLGLEPVGMLHVAGLGDYATEVVHAGPLQMGGVRFGDMNYIVLNDIHRYGYDLVIGADVLASMPISIDYTHHLLTFNASPHAAEQSDAGTTVSLAFENFVPIVDVTLGGRETALAIDTGDQSTINLAYGYYQAHPDLFKAVKTENVSGVGGSSVEVLGEIASIRIGTLTAQNQQIGATQTLKGTADGHLGAGFLSKYRIVLDYAHQRMDLYPLRPL